MLQAFLTGFFLGLSLIVAIGAQNAFVLRQGILREHIFYIALFCSIADSLLITLGVIGISYFFEDFINEHSKIIFGIAALWLFTYGILRLKSALKSSSIILESKINSNNLLSTISTIAVFTFLNPHVYLDTMILIGSVSQQFLDLNRLFFAIGACLASFIWFFSLAYGAKILSPRIHKPLHWRFLDTSIATIMFIIGFNIALQGGWF